MNSNKESHFHFSCISANDILKNTKKFDIPEVFSQKCSVKTAFLKIFHNSQGNACAKVSFLVKLWTAPGNLLKSRLYHKCFPVTSAKF